jgi:alpha-tubulin suppressor-like RCC1 family protein
MRIRLWNRTFSGALVRVVCTGVLVALCTACGGSDSEGDETDGDPLLTIDQSLVAVQIGGSVRVRVDVRNYRDSQGISGYQTTFDEVGTRIDITTGPCASGTGTPWCQEWTITPAPDVLPGEYFGLVRAFGNRQPVQRGGLTVIVLPNPAVPGPAAVFADGDDEREATLVITEDGKLWGAGENTFGQLRSSAYSLDFNGAVDFSDRTHAQPGVLPFAVPLFGALPVSPLADRADTPNWKQVATGGSFTIALRDDGSVWAWGQNLNNGLGFETAAGFPRIQLPPHQVPVLADIVAISTLRVGGRHGSLAVTREGTVYAWGDNYEGTDEIVAPKQVPAGVAADGSLFPLTDVRTVAGGGDQVGTGAAVALKRDGSVWVWGRDRFVHTFEDRDPVYAMPRQVQGLPANVVEIAMQGGPNSSNGSAGLALTNDGQVFVFPPDKSAGDSAPAATQLTGIGPIVHIAGGTKFALAIRNDGRVLRWAPGVTAPTLIAGLENVIAIGEGHAVVDECVRGGSVGRGGSVWRIDPDGNVFRIPEFIGSRCSPQFSSLRVVKRGEGAVLSTPIYIDCGTRCEVPVSRGTTVQLVALPPLGFDAVWSGEGCASGEVKLTQDRICTVTFFPALVEMMALTLTVNGQGTVTSAPAGVSCPGDCGEELREGTEVELTATPAAGWNFYGFDGVADCTDGIVAMGSAKSCSATFILPTLLEIFVAGQGTVRSQSAGIDCGLDCRERYLVDTSVQLTATAAEGWIFVRFAGDADCVDGTVTMNASKGCYAVFIRNIPPAAPIALRAIPGSTFIDLFWNSNPDVALYSLVRSPGDGGDLSKTYSFGGSASTYHDTGLAPGTTYTYRLTAQNAAGVSPSALAIATTDVVDGWAEVDAPIPVSAAFDQPAIVSLDGNGDVAVAYARSTGTSTVIEVRRRSRNMQSWVSLGASPGELLSQPNLSSQPSLAVDSSGRAIVAWTERTSSGQDVWVARFDSTSAAWQLLGNAPVDVDLGNPVLNEASQPSLVVDGAGNPVIAWLQSGQVFVKRWNGSAWAPLAAGAGPPSAQASAVKLALDSSGNPYVAWRRASGTATQLFVHRGTATQWSQLGGSLNQQLPASNAFLAFFGIVLDNNDVPRVVWSEGAVPFDVLASEWNGSSWVALPKLVDRETSYAITGLAVARGGSDVNGAPVVAYAQQPAFDGANTNQGSARAYRLNAGAWVNLSYTLIAPGPMHGLSLAVERLATPVVCWIDAIDPAPDSFQVLTWRRSAVP